MNLLEISKAPKAYTFYHGTKNPEAIKLHGFKIDGTGGHRNSSGPYGDGIYLSPTMTFAKTYGVVLKIEAMLKLKTMTSAQWADEMKGAEFQSWYKAQDGTPGSLMSTWFQNQGYDGIFVKIGSDLDQAVVYTPEKLTIV